MLLFVYVASILHLLWLVVGVFFYFALVLADHVVGISIGFNATNIDVDYFYSICFFSVKEILCGESNTPIFGLVPQF